MAHSHVTEVGVCPGRFPSSSQSLECDDPAATNVLSATVHNGSPRMSPNVPVCPDGSRRVTMSGPLNFAINSVFDDAANRITSSGDCKPNPGIDSESETHRFNSDATMYYVLSNSC